LVGVHDIEQGNVAEYDVPGAALSMEKPPAVEKRKAGKMMKKLFRSISRRKTNVLLRT